MRGQNLVPNPSFEDTLLCPEFLDQVYATSGWESYGNSPDYFNECSTASLNVPNASFGFQYAQDGSAFVGLIPYAKDNPNYREFVGRELAIDLEIGTEYYISFYGNCANLETYRYAVNNIGVLFSTVPYSSNNTIELQNSAHVFSHDVIADTVDWTLVDGTFTADSAYRYLIIGNFFDDAHTDTMDIGQFNQRSYYYVDNVCVREIDGDCLLSLTVGQGKNNQDVLNVFPNPIVDFVSIQTEGQPILGISIFDISGRHVVNFSGLTQNRIQLQLGDLDNGTYVMKIETSQMQLTEIITKTN